MHPSDEYKSGCLPICPPPPTPNSPFFLKSWVDSRTREFPTFVILQASTGIQDKHGRRTLVFFNLFSIRRRGAPLLLLSEVYEVPSSPELSISCNSAVPRPPIVDGLVFLRVSRARCFFPTRPSTQFLMYWQFFFSP